MRFPPISCVLLLSIALAGSLISPYTTPADAVRTSQTGPQMGGGAWLPFGPAPIRNCGGGSPPDQCSGRVSAIAIDPNNVNMIYVGSATGGVWKTVDGGSNWTPLMDSLAEGSLNIGALAIDPVGVIYAGTGDGNWGWYGAGILKSTDAGKTWTSLGASTFGRSALTKLAIDPTNPNRIFATATFGYTTGSYIPSVYVEPGVPLGVFFSSDGGNSWTLSRRTRSSDFDKQAWDVLIDPTNPSTVYSALDGGVYVSHDGGGTWTVLSAGGLPSSSSVGRISLAISVSSHLTLYAAMQYFDGSSDNGVGRLYKTIDGGSTWSMINTPPAAKKRDNGFCGKQCDYNLYVTVDPSDQNTIYLGGLDLYRSTNGGTAWTDLGGYTDPGLIHTDQHAYAFSPTSHSTIYIGNDGGIWSSTTANSCTPSSCWTDLNTGLGITQFYSIAVDPLDSSHLLGGTQDNGCLSHKGFASIWTEDNNCGDGGWTGFDPKNPQTIYEAEQWSCYKKGCDPLFRSDNGGATWKPIENGLIADDKANFMIPLAIDPTNPSTLYLGTTNLYKTTSKGNQWFKPNPGLSFLTPANCFEGDCITAIAVAPSSSDYVYVGTTRGEVFLSEDAANHFTKTAYGLPSLPVTQIAVDPGIPTQVYATFTGFGNKHVFSSSNAGSTWNDISANLPDEPVNTITLNQDGKAIYVGTDRAVYVSLSNGQSWVALGKGLPRVPVLDLKFASDGRLWAATHGRGAWAYSSKILIIFGNVAPDATVLIDGFSYTGSQLSSTSFNWDPGSIHTLQVNQTEPGPPGFRLLFVKWNDGSTDLTRTITANIPGDYSAIFKTQYELTVISDFDNPQGGGWYDAGATATYSVSSPTPLPGIFGLLGAKATFLRWKNGITSTTSNTVMNGPLTVQAFWQTDYTPAYINALAVFAAVSTVVVAVLFLVRKRTRARPKKRSAGICPHCGNDLPPDSSFCIKCGAPVQT